MKNFCLILPVSKERIEVTVIRKRMKNVRLRILSDLTVVLSSPKHVSDEWLTKFIQENNFWLEEKLALLRRKHKSKHELPWGISQNVLGKNVLIHIEESKVKKVVLLEDKIVIFTPDKNDQLTISKQFEEWWRNEAGRYYDAILTRYFHLVAKEGFERPRLQVRKMKTLWGSYSVKQHRINVNYYLFGALPQSIEYVVLHELAHVLHRNHGKQFQGFLSKHMPDWKERKRALKSEAAEVL